ncbi:hypothetical protein JCM5350_007074 [Sporobolomyces pararoseus]
MASNTSLRQPAGSTSTVPKHQSTNTNLPPPSTSSRLARPLNSSRTNANTSLTRDNSAPGTSGGAARRVSQSGNNRDLRASTSDSGTVPSTARPRRILQSVQENAQSLNDGVGASREKSMPSTGGARSIRPPSAQSHSSSACLQPPSTVSSTPATPLRQSQLSRSTSSRAGLTFPESPSTVRPKDRRLGTAKPLDSSTSSSRSGPRISATATSRRILSGNSLRPVAGLGNSTDSPRKAKERVPLTSSSPRKPSLNRSTSSSSTLRRSTTTTSMNRDSPLKRSTTTSRLPHPSSSSLMRPPSSTSTLPRATARRIPLPVSSNSSSSIPIFSSSSSSTTGPTTSSNSTKEPRNRLGLGMPPVTGGGARRVSVANVRLGGGGSTTNTRTPNNRRGETPKRSSALRSSTLRSTDISQRDEEDDRNRRDSRTRRESWETVGSNQARSRSTSIASTASTARNRVASDTGLMHESNGVESPMADRKTSYSTPSKSLSTSQTPRFNAVLLSPPGTNQQASSLPSAPPENRQLSLLRSSDSAAPTSNSTPDPLSRRRQPRGSTTLEELLQNGLFSSPSLSTQTPLGKTNAQGGGNDFEFLMDEEVSRIMLEEIQSSSAGGIGGGTPWRGRVVSLSMSGNGSARKPRRGEGGGDISFEMDYEGTENDAHSEREDGDGEGEVEEARMEMSREILVLQRVDEEQLEALRKEKEALAQEVEILKTEKRKEEEGTKRQLEERFEMQMDEKKKEWEREKLELERSLAALKTTRGTQLDLELLKATTAYKASQMGYEHVVSAASREREELSGALEGLKIIARGLEAWEALG